MRRIWMRGTMNPAASPHLTGTFPSDSRKAMVRSATSGLVFSPGTTSTSGMMCAGFSQCATRKRSGPGTASARCAGEMVDEVDARRQVPVERREDLALEVARFRQRLLHETARLQPAEVGAVLDAAERGRDGSRLDHALFGHEAEVARDLAARIGESAVSRAR